MTKTPTKEEYIKFFRTLNMLFYLGNRDVTNKILKTTMPRFRSRQTIASQKSVLTSKGAVMQ